MLRVGRYVFKRAESDDELEQVHRLNYRTFVGEVGQYTDDGSGRLVDKFHDKNVYFIALRDGRVVGMVSAHGRPPFSVASRLADRSILERPGAKPIEVRLLAVDPEERKGPAAFGLFCAFYDYAWEHGHTEVYISGVEEQVGLYRHMGFEPLGPPVACGSAAFVPMRITLADLKARSGYLCEMWARRAKRRETSPRPTTERPVRREELSWDDEPAETALLCLLPGPVTTSAAVREAFRQPPIYHRGPRFIAQFERVRSTLAALTSARNVALFNGSGTLANEVVAATLGAEPDARAASGLILVNGEFGERLVQQSARFGLQARVLRWPWGQPWDLEEVDSTLAQAPPGSWVWGVHQESSTGVLNDLPGLVRTARQHGIRVCIDCISSLGAVPLDLREVYLATGATGKALAAYAGTAIVFADAERLGQLDLSRVPSYLDLPATLATRGPRFTFPSPTIQALQAALAEYATPRQAQARYERYASQGAWVRQRLREAGLSPLADEAVASPVITSFAPPDGQSSAAFVERCKSWGFAIGGESRYLAERRLVQIATMGAVALPEIEPLFDRLAQWLALAVAAMK